jgi:membrane-associated phospholipid phosphatase
MRGIGLPGALGELLGPLVVVFAVLTQLGDLWLLTLATTLPYWLDRHTPGIAADIDRERAATVVALLFGAIALLVTLKPLFGLPRPPGAGVAPRADLIPAALEGLYAWLSTGDGFGFPSGHALGSTIVFGGLAWTVRIGPARRRFALAGGLATLVSLSRVVLGLHYLVDVVAGAAIGVAYLAVVLRVLGTPRRAFGLAAVLVVGGLAVVGPHPEGVAAAGLCVGGAVAWLAVGDRVLALDADRTAATAAALLGLATAAPLLAVVGTVSLTAPLAVGGGLLGGALVVALPLVGDGVAKKVV